MKFDRFAKNKCDDPWGKGIFRDVDVQAQVRFVPEFGRRRLETYQFPYGSSDNVGYWIFFFFHIISFDSCCNISCLHLLFVLCKY